MATCQHSRQTRPPGASPHCRRKPRFPFGPHLLGISAPPTYPCYCALLLGMSRAGCPTTCLVLSPITTDILRRVAATTAAAPVEGEPGPTDKESVCLSAARIRCLNLPGEGIGVNVIDCTAREYASRRRMCRGPLGTAIACKSWSRDWGPSRRPGHTKHECSQDGGFGPSSLRTHCAGGARYCGRKPASRSPFWQSSGEAVRVSCSWRKEAKQVGVWMGQC
jgi:hypothetical protein